MTSWLERQASSHHFQLAAVAVASGALVAGAIYGSQAIRREKRVSNLKASIPQLDESHHAEMLPDYSTFPTSTNKEDTASAALARRAQMGDFDPSLIQEQLTRTASFLGPTTGFPRLRTAFVIVVGLGGVGSHATSALARSGVSKIRLIDFDQVTLSSLNRHSLATLPDVGTPKVDCVRKRLQAVVPWVEFDCRNEIFRVEAADRLLGPWSSSSSSSHGSASGTDTPKPDFIIDAIDNIDSKVTLLHYCHTNHLPIISSMGSGCKSDPSRLTLGDISQTLEDPLSRSTRRRLRLLNIHSGIPVIYSTEKPSPDKAQLLPLPDDEFAAGKAHELSVLPDFRARVLPVLGTMPAAFGLAAANYVILTLADYPRETIAGGRGEKTYEQILSTLQSTEERLIRNSGANAVGVKIPISRGDVEYLVEEVYRGKSVVSGVSTRLALVRWERPERGFGIDDGGVEGQRVVRLGVNELVLMTREEAAVHEKVILTAEAGEGKKVEDYYQESVLELVEKRREEERWFERYR